METISSSLSYQVGQRRASDRLVNIETDRFRLRTLKPSDASREFLDWIANPELMTPLNMPPRNLNQDELESYIEAFDNRSRYLVGMFDKQNDTHFGILVMDVNNTHGFGKMSFLVGHRDYRRVGAFRETAAGLIANMFDERGLEKVIVHVVVGNEPSMKALEALGFTNEGTLRSHVKSFVGDGRHDQYHYGLLKGELRLP